MYHRQDTVRKGASHYTKGTWTRFALEERDWFPSQSADILSSQPSENIVAGSNTGDEKVRLTSKNLFRAGAFACFNFVRKFRKRRHLLRHVSIMSGGISCGGNTGLEGHKRTD